MAHVGALPETNDILSPVIIALFGMPSPLAKIEEECHFFLETITKEQFLVLILPSCGHFRHTECFKTWASHTESTVRCAYVLQNNIPVRRCVLPLLTRVHRQTQLYNVLPCENSHRMHNRHHGPALTPNPRSLDGMRTARSL